jgi:hypothetical protein
VGAEGFPPTKYARTPTTAPAPARANATFEIVAIVLAPPRTPSSVGLQRVPPFWHRPELFTPFVSEMDTSPVTTPVSAPATVREKPLTRIAGEPSRLAFEAFADGAR